MVSSMCHAQYSNHQLYEAYITRDMSVWEQYIDSADWDSLDIEERKQLLNYEYGFSAYILGIDVEKGKQLIQRFASHLEEMKSELRRQFLGEKRLFVLDYTTEVSLYMDACDILFTKPGGLSSTEAAVKGIPMIHSTPIPGWEESNVRFFTDHGLSVFGESPDELVTAALYLLSNPWKREAMLSAQVDTINKHAARDICEKIINDRRKD